MQEIFEKIRERLEREVEYQSSKADAAGKTCAFEEITVVKAREKMAECYEHAIEIVNQVAEEYSSKSSSSENDGWISLPKVAFDRMIARMESESEKDWNDEEWFINVVEAARIMREIVKEYVPNINVGKNEEFCEWFKYDYRTIAPKNHDIGNPYWRIPDSMSKLRFCPYCGKEIKVVE